MSILGLEDLHNFIVLLYWGSKRKDLLLLCLIDMLVDMANTTSSSAFMN